MSRVVWNENAIPPEAIDAGLKQAAIVAQTEMRRNFGSEGGGVDPAKTKRKRRNVYKPSPPGRFPGVRTGFLRRAVMYWFPVSSAGKRAQFVRIGVPSGLTDTEGTDIATYAAALELSANPNMRRPWAMRSVTKAKSPMSRAFARGMRQYLAGRSG